MNIIVIILVLLTGGSSYQAVKEHKQIAAIHAQADQQKATIAQLQTSVSQQKLAIDQEGADKAAADAAAGKKSQIRSTYEVATDTALNSSPADLQEAVSFNSLALQAGDPPSAATLTAGKQLGAAKGTDQAALIAELQGELKQLTDAKNAAEANFQADHAKVVAYAGSNATLTATVGQQNTKIGTLSTEATSLAGKLGLASALVGRYVFWIAIAIGAFFLLTWIFPAVARDIPALAKVFMGLAHGLFHPMVALFEDVIADAKADLAAEQAAHTVTKAALAAATAPAPAKPVTSTAAVPTS